MDDKKTTKGFKVSGDTKAWIDALYANSGFEDQEDFLKHLGSLHEMQKMKNGELAGYAAQLDELEFHGRRVNEIFLSVLQTEQVVRAKLGEEYSERVAEYTVQLSAQQDELRDLNDLLKGSRKELADLREAAASLDKQVSHLEQSNTRSEELLAEYKTRIESLTVLVADQQEQVNQAKASEKELTRLTQLTNDLERRAAQMTQEAVKHADEVERQRQAAAEQAKRELEAALLRADLEKEKALVSLRAELQQELAQERNKHMEDTRALYAELNELRKQLAERQKDKE